MLWPLSATANCVVKWHPQIGSALCGKVYPMTSYRHWGYVIWVPVQSILGSGPARQAWHWVAKSIQRLFIGTGAMSSGCLCNPYWAVVLPDRHGIGWQSLSNIFYKHLCYGPRAPVQSSLGSWPAKMSRHCVARGIQLFSIGLWAMCTVCNVDAVSLAGVQQVYL